MAVALRSTARGSRTSGAWEEVQNRHSRLGKHQAFILTVLGSSQRIVSPFHLICSEDPEHRCKTQRVGVKKQHIDYETQLP